MKRFRKILSLFYLFFLATITQAFPDTSMENLPCNEAITLINPDQYSLTVSHEEIPVESPDIGLFISVNLIGDDQPEIQLICDAAALGKTISLTMEQSSISYQIPDETIDWRSSDISITLPLIDTFQPIAKVNKYYESTIMVSGDNSIVSHNLDQISNSIPGLALKKINNEFVLKGSPEQSGNYHFTLAVITENLTQTVSYKVHVFDELELMQKDLPIATYGEQYSAFITAKGGIPPYTFTIIKGNLPNDLYFNSDTNAALIAGTVDNHSNHAFVTIQVQDSTSVSTTCQRRYPIFIKPYFRQALVPSTQSMRYNGTNFTIDNEPAQIGDEIAVYDPDGILCGIHKVETPGCYTITVYGDDPTTQDVDEGAIQGDLLTFRVWNLRHLCEIAITEDMFVPITNGNVQQ